MAALAVEARGVPRIGRLIFHLQKFAAIAEGPAMKRTREGRAISFFEAAQNRTAVRAGVGQRIELAVLAPRDDYGLAPDVNSHKVIDVRNLAFVGEVDPVTLKDVLEFQLEKLLVGESGPIKLIDMVYQVFVQHRLELCDTISVACAHLNHAGLLLTNHANLLFTFGMKAPLSRGATKSWGIARLCASTSRMEHPVPM